MSTSTGTTRVALHDQFEAVSALRRTRDRSHETPVEVSPPSIHDVGTS